MTKPIRRKDNKGRVLKDGESQRKDGRYVYRYTKNNITHSIYGDTLENLRKQEAELKRDLEDGIRIDCGNITLNDMYSKWLLTKSTLKDSTFTNYKYLYEANIKDILGNIPLKKIKKSDIKAFYQSLLTVNSKRPKQKSVEKPRALSTITNIHNLLYQIFDLAVEDDYIRKNPCHNAMKDIKATAPKKEKVKSLKDKELKAFLNYTKNSKKYSHWWPAFMILANSGLRVGELTALCWESDIDFENECMHISKTLSYRSTRSGYCGYTLTSPKTENGYRTVPMTPTVKETLQKLYEDYKEFNLTSNISIGGRTDFVFLNKYKNPHTEKTLNLALARILKDYDKYESEQAILENREPLKIPKFTCHVLRHPYVKHTTKNISLQKQKSQTTNSNLIVWGFCFCVLKLYGCLLCVSVYYARLF